MRHRSNGARVAEKAQDLYETSRKAAEEGGSRVRSFIEEKPLTSALIGVGVGFFLASLFRPRE
jgi:ElaB/YqjD/DUF883 family membrane-anchored ribosome-binding protein